MKLLRGRAVSPGLASGRAVVYGPMQEVTVPRYNVPANAIDSEHLRLEEAVSRTINEIEGLRARVMDELGPAQARIFGAHIAMTRDRHLLQKVRQRVAAELINVEQALEAEMLEMASTLSQAEDAYLRERAEDLRDVARRMIRHLTPQGRSVLEQLPANSVLVAPMLLPSDTVRFDREHVTAIVTERGGPNSHAAIIARSMGIPAVAGVAEACVRIPAGVEVLVDAEAGQVIVNPRPDQVERFARQLRRLSESNAVAQAAERRQCVMEDGHCVHLLANIGRVQDVPQVLEHSLEGVGLFRTEYLFLTQDTPPDFEHQRRIYCEAAAALGPRRLVIRTLDLGGDKKPQFLGAEGKEIPVGLRGLRFALDTIPHVIRTQLRAICSTEGEHVHVLFPMVTGLDDFAQAVRMLEDVAREVWGSSRHIPTGAMIETPASVMLVREILSQADFLSIGTNDLTQLMLASHRDASHLDDAVLHPAVLRAVRQVSEAAHEAGKRLTVCGEAAGDPLVAAVLVGLGVDELSMSPPRAARVRLRLQHCRLDTLEALAERMLACQSIEQARQEMLQTLPAIPIVGRALL